MVLLFVGYFGETDSYPVLVLGGHVLCLTTIQKHMFKFLLTVVVYLYYRFQLSAGVPDVMEIFNSDT